MSLAKIREAAKNAPGAFVTVQGADLKAALEEAKTPQTDELLAHVNQKVKQNPDCMMQVHRDVHLGKFLGVNEPPAMTPGTSTLET